MEKIINPLQNTDEVTPIAVSFRIVCYTASNAPLIDSLVFFLIHFSVI